MADKKVKATLYISEDKREMIRRSGRSLEEYFNHLYEDHVRFSMDKWSDGAFWVGYLRVCLFRAETVNMIISRLENDAVVDVGFKVGMDEKTYVMFDCDLEPVDDESRLRMLERVNSLYGWGLFTLRNSVVIVSQPVFSGHYFFQGFLEGYLDLELHPLESFPDRLTFQVLHRGGDAS